MKIITAKEAARLLKINPHEISGFIRIGILKAQRNGQSYAILKEDLIQFAQDRGIEIQEEVENDAVLAD